jgi:TfoX/Sxy family transcriptional regulator of competence genes
MSASDDGHTSGSGMPKPSPEAIERFKAALPDDARVSLRPMFGNLSAFANGYMFAGLFGDDVFVRLDDAGQARITAQGGSAFAPMPGRPMRDYVVLPDAMTSDRSGLRTALAESLGHTVALPPKAPKKPKAAKPPKVAKRTSG